MYAAAQAANIMLKAASYMTMNCAPNVLLP